MSIRVKSIDVYGIEDRLRKSKDPKDKEVLQYIKALKEALKRQQDLTNECISKLRQVGKS
jgi:hypothetical protein